MAKDLATIATILLGALVLISLYFNWDMKQTIEAQREELTELRDEINFSGLNNEQQAIIEMLEADPEVVRDTIAEKPAPAKSFGFSLPKGWNMRRDGSTYYVDGTGYQGQMDITYRFDLYQKQASQTLAQWIDENESRLYSSSIRADRECPVIKESDQMELRKCFGAAAEYFFVSSDEKNLLHIVLGQDPPLTEDALWSLVQYGA